MRRGRSAPRFVPSCARWHVPRCVVLRRDGTRQVCIGLVSGLIQVPRRDRLMSADTTLTCRDCGQAFTFTSGEQEFYASRGYSEPGRCPDCRAQRKAERGSGGGSYSSYGSGGGSGGGYGGSSRGPREMFSATC